MNDAVHANARPVAAALTDRSPILRELAGTGKPKIVVAIYDLEGGKLEIE